MPQHSKEGSAYLLDAAAAWHGNTKAAEPAHDAFDSEGP